MHEYEHIAHLFDGIPFARAWISNSSVLFDRFIQLNTKLLLSTCNVQFFNAQSSFLTQLMPIKH